MQMSPATAWASELQGLISFHPPAPRWQHKLVCKLNIVATKSWLSSSALRLWHLVLKCRKLCVVYLLIMMTDSTVYKIRCQCRNLKRTCLFLMQNLGTLYQRTEMLSSICNEWVDGDWWPVQKHLCDESWLPLYYRAHFLKLLVYLCLISGALLYGGFINRTVLSYSLLNITRVLALCIYLRIWNGICKWNGKLVVREEFNKEHLIEGCILFQVAAILPSEKSREPTMVIQT
jgi:hypothetical protein